MTPSERLRAKHVPYHKNFGADVFCRDCTPLTAWPCDVIQVLDELEATLPLPLTLRESVAEAIRAQDVSAVQEWYDRSDKFYADMQARIRSLEDKVKVADALAEAMEVHLNYSTYTEADILRRENLWKALRAYRGTE